MRERGHFEEPSDLRFKLTFVAIDVIVDANFETVSNPLQLGGSRYENPNPPAAQEPITDVETANEYNDIESGVDPNTGSNLDRDRISDPALAESAVSDKEESLAPVGGLIIYSSPVGADAIPGALDSSTTQQSPVEDEYRADVKL